MEERLVSGETIPREDDAEITLRPRTLREFIGQNQLKENLRFLSRLPASGRMLWIMFALRAPGLGKPHWLILLPKR